MAEEHEPVTAASGAIKLSRYVLLSRIAAGGAGVVYSGYDPELDRKIAVKLLLPLTSRKGDDTGAAVRLMREAQATARLSHPNVVAIYDVGTYDLEDADLSALTHDLDPGEEDPRAPQRRGVFVVMELVEGTNLRDWMRAGGHAWEEVLRVFLSAGEGLAAAHARELVHRDFKPANVIVGTNGRARVLDFGLARLVSNRPEMETTANPGSNPTPEKTGSTLGEEDLELRSDLGDEATVQYAKETLMVPSSDGMAEFKILESRLTRTGTVMGTPAYMSPEQHHAGSTDERTDQFSFCVALYEALYAKRPFVGETMEDLAEAKETGLADGAEDGGSAPAHVRSALRKGLSPDPAERFPSMRALLDTLADDPRLRRRRWIAIGGVVAVIAGVGFGVQSWERGRAQSCDAHLGAFKEVWSAEAKSGAAAGFAAIDKPYATDAWTIVERGLDAYTTKWTELRRDTCVASESGGELAPVIATRRISCLDQRRHAIDELLVVLQNVDSDVAAHAIEAVDALPDLATCADDDALLAGAVPPTAAERESVLQVEALLARGGALRSAGKYKDALPIAREAVAASEELIHAETRARALLGLSDAQNSMADYDASEAAAFEAWHLAEAAGLQDIGTDAIIRLIVLTGYRHARQDEGRRMAQLAEARLKRRTVSDQDARLAYNSGLLYYVVGKHEEAAESLGRAIAVYSERFGADNLKVTQAFNVLGASALKAGRTKEAREALEKAVELRRSKLGRHHPEVAQPLNNLALVVLEEGDTKLALELFEETLEIRSSALGEQHELVSASLMNIGITRMEMGEYEPALDYVKRSLAITENTYGREHPITADAVANVANVLNHLGRFEEALPMHEESLAVRAKLLGEEHTSVGVGHYELAETLLALKRHEDALGHYQTALRTLEVGLGPEAPQLLPPLLGIGEAKLALGDAEAATRSLERAAASGEADSPPTVDRARVMFALARAIQKSQPQRALRLASEAQPTFESSTSKTLDVDGFRSWMRTHDRDR
jgi:serine/threonine protein kinase/tetratricopeptide (TPR) repeat protein